MNILIIHEVDYLRKVVYEFQTMADLLSLAGHNVYVVDYESMWNKKGVGSLRTKEMEVARVYSKSKVKVIHPGFIRIPVISRISVFITHYFTIKKVIKEKKIDVILLYSVPTNGLQTVFLAKRFGIPVVFRLLDTLNQLVPNRFLSKITYYMEKSVYPRVKIVLTVSPKLAEYAKRMGAKKVRVLPLGVDTDLFHPDIDTTELRKRWELGDKVVVFVGTLPKFSGLDMFICGFYHLLCHEPKAQLLIVGDGEQRKDLEWFANWCGIGDRVIITGFQPHESIPQYINLASVCISPFLVTDVTRDIFPTKVMLYLACGKPVVSSPLDGMKDMVNEEQGVIYIDNGLEQAEILKLLRSDERRNKLGQAGLDYVKETHSYGRIIKQLETVFNEYCLDKS